jgi:hypothetical protein
VDVATLKASNNRQRTEVAILKSTNDKLRNEVVRLTQALDAVVHEKRVLANDLKWMRGEH